MPDLRQMPPEPGGLFTPPDTLPNRQDSPQAKETAFAGILARESLPHNGTPTSIDASKRAEGVAGEQREIVFSLIALAGSNGLTRAEIISATGLRENSVNPRVWELMNAGRIAGLGRRDGRQVLVVSEGNNGAGQ